jgi:phosphate transport system protein
MTNTRTRFESGLQQLRDRILDMGLRADSMLADAIRAAVEQDADLATQVVRSDREVDRADIDIETDCMLLIALEAPVAKDMRLIGSSMKIISDLERIADYAVDIAKIGRRLAREMRYQPLVDLAKLGGRARAMLQEALKAFVNGDVALAARVVEMDNDVDALFHEQRDYLLELLDRETGHGYAGGNLLLAVKYLERIGDHATNIAERIAYIETGNAAGTAEPRTGE